MKPLFLSQIKPALKLFLDSRKLIALCTLIDVVFFIVIAGIHYAMFTRLKGTFETLMAEIEQNTQQLLTQESMTSLNSQLMQSAKFMSAYHQMQKYIALFFLAVFITWIVLKGINWLIANKIVRKKLNTISYMKYFAAYSLLWLAGIIIILSIAGVLASYSSGQFLPLIGSTGNKIITSILFFALAYFAFISYAAIPEIKFKDVFRKGIKKWKELVPASIIVILITALAAYIPVQLAAIEHPAIYWLTLAFAILISIPALAYGRIYISLIIHKRIEKDG